MFQCVVISIKETANAFSLHDCHVQKAQLFAQGWQNLSTLHLWLVWHENLIEPLIRARDQNPATTSNNDIVSKTVICHSGAAYEDIMTIIVIINKLRNLYVYIATDLESFS